MIGRFWVITEDLAPVQLRMEYIWSTMEYTTPHDNAHFLWLDKYPFGDEDSCLEFRISKAKPRVREGQKATGPS